MVIMSVPALGETLRLLSGDIDMNRDLKCDTQRHVKSNLYISHLYTAQTEDPRETRSGPEGQSPEFWFLFSGLLLWGLPSGGAITGKS